MAKLEGLLDVPEISAGTNFWMIRTKRGFFFDEYIHKGFIAIGWNSITNSMICNGLTKDQSEQLRKSIKEIYDEKMPGMALNKCIRFCNEMKPGDIGIIVDNQRIAFVSIGEFYEEKRPEFSAEYERDIHAQIEKANANLSRFECPYIKRRKISLIKVLREGDIVSPYLQGAIARNLHSLSEMNDYGEIILSGCFDAFIYHNKLTMTFRVAQRGDINVLDLSNFVLNTARILSNDHPENVSVKTTLHSPGDVVLQIIDFVKANPIALIVGYVAVFGGKVKGCEFNSLIGCIKDLIDRKYEKEKREIELRKLSAEADLAEQNALEKKLANIKTQRDLQISIANSYVAPVAAAAKKLDITPNRGTIIDISSILERNSQDSKND